MGGRRPMPYPDIPIPSNGMDGICDLLKGMGLFNPDLSLPRKVTLPQPSPVEGCKPGSQEAALLVLLSAAELYTAVRINASATDKSSFIYIDSRRFVAGNVFKMLQALATFRPWSEWESVEFDDVEPQSDKTLEAGNILVWSAALAMSDDPSSVTATVDVDACARMIASLVAGKFTEAELAMEYDRWCGLVGQGEPA